MSNKSTRYVYYLNKKDSIRRMREAFETCSEVLFQETELAVKRMEIEMSSENTVSMPPHYFKMIKVVKEIGELIELIESDRFESIED